MPLTRIFVEAELGTETIKNIEFDLYILCNTLNSIFSGTKAQRAKMQKQKKNRMIWFKRRFRRAFGLCAFEPNPDGGKNIDL